MARRRTRTLRRRRPACGGEISEQDRYPGPPIFFRRRGGGRHHGRRRRRRFQHAAGAAGPKSRTTRLGRGSRDRVRGAHRRNVRSDRRRLPPRPRRRRPSRPRRSRSACESAGLGRLPLAQRKDTVVHPRLGRQGQTHCAGDGGERLAGVVLHLGMVRRIDRPLGDVLRQRHPHPRQRLQGSQPQLGARDGDFDPGGRSWSGGGGFGRHNGIIADCGGKSSEMSEASPCRTPFAGRRRSSVVERIVVELRSGVQFSAAAPDFLDAPDVCEIGRACA